MYCRHFVLSQFWIITYYNIHWRWGEISGLTSSGLKSILETLMQPLQTLTSEIFSSILKYLILPFLCFMPLMKINTFLKILVGRCNKLEYLHWLWQMLPEDITCKFSCIMKIKLLVPFSFPEKHFYSSIFSALCLFYLVSC